MEDKTTVDETTISPDVTTTSDAGKTEETSQDPVQKELDRVRKPKTEREKAEHVLLSTANRLKELGADPKGLLGVKEEKPEVDEEIPEWYKREQAKRTEKDALSLADSEIKDSYERELVKHQLETTITSGTPEERLRVARGYVNSLKNAQIAEDAGRKPQAKTFASSPGAPAKEQPEMPELSKSEKDMDDWVFKNTGKHMTAEEIIAARG